MDAALIIFISLFFVFGLPIIFLIVYFAKVHKPLEQAKINTPQEVIVKEVVMVPSNTAADSCPQQQHNAPTAKHQEKHKAFFYHVCALFVLSYEHA